MLSGGFPGPVQVVWSQFLGRGSEPGFAFIFRPGRLAGAAKPTRGTLVLLGESQVRRSHLSLGSRPLLSEEAVPPVVVAESTVVKESRYVVAEPEEARRIAARLGVDQPPTPSALPDLEAVLRELEGAKVFELDSGDVSRIEIAGASPDSAGRIVIRTPKEIQAVNVRHALTPAEDPVPVLVPLLEEFAPARVVRRR